MKELALRPVRIPRASQFHVAVVAHCRRVTLVGFAEPAHIGNSRPRVFPTFPEPTTTAPKKRTKANTGAKRGPKSASATKASKPTGVTKKAPVKKAATATKVRYILSRNYLLFSNANYHSRLL